METTYSLRKMRCLIPYRRRVIFKLVRWSLILFVLAIFTWNILLNVWWLFDCRICFGHQCAGSICEDYRPKCIDKCSQHNLLHDKQIRFKHTNNVTHLVQSETFWQKIFVESDDTFYVYSAFSNINSKSIIILAAVSPNYTEHLFDKYSEQFHCHFMDENLNVISRSNLVFNAIKSREPLHTARITCDLMADIKPKYVKLGHRIKIDLSSHPIIIEYESSTSMIKRPDVVVCVRPFFNNYSSISKLIEFIAYYRTHGVHKFIFYKESVSDPVLQLLRAMSDFVDVHPWVLKNGQRFPDDYQIHQYAAADDCFHRFRFKIIIFIDIDEFIIPFQKKTLKDLIYREYDGSNTVGLATRNVFFCCEFNANQTEEFPRILSHFNRQRHVWHSNWRSKPIILRPYFVERMGIHSVISFTAQAPYNELKPLDANDALMFHYRSCCDVARTPILHGLISFPTEIDSIKYDNRMIKYQDSIHSFIHRYIDF